MDIKLIVSIFLFGIFTVGCEASSHHWNYLSFGPGEWYEKYPTCDKNSQSPIDIELDEVYELNKQKIRHNYNSKFGGEYTAINNGHALQINFPEDTKYRLKKGSRVYTPLQVHIHFNPFTLQGSEHTVNEKKYFAEVHIVHKRTYKKEFMKMKDGLLVIGMFVDVPQAFEQSTERRFHADPRATSPALKKFIKVAKACPEPSSTMKLKAFPLSLLFPTGQQRGRYNYVNYEGSLTTPPCSEVVDWVVVVGKTLKISLADMEAFKPVHNSNHHKLMGDDGGNNRPVQPLNGRKVYGIKQEIF